MPLRCRASHMFLLLCALSLCVESVRGGTSFLSPAQKPQVSVCQVDVLYVWSKPMHVNLSRSKLQMNARNLASNVSNFKGRRPPRVGRRDINEPEIPVIKEDDQFMVKTASALLNSISTSCYCSHNLFSLFI